MNGIWKYIATSAVSGLIVAGIAWATFPTDLAKRADVAEVKSKVSLLAERISKLEGRLDAELRRGP